jgi:phosphate/sulfate permease
MLIFAALFFSLICGGTIAIFVIDAIEKAIANQRQKDIHKIIRHINIIYKLDRSK